MKLKPFHLLSLRFITKPIHFRCFPFSTSLGALNNHKVSHSFHDVVSDGSAVYRHALKYQRPASVQWSQQLENSASFIGTVSREPSIINSKIGEFGVYTFLQVQRSNQPGSSFFCVVLMMRGRMAYIASEHLKANDFIYVSGCLGSYTKADSTGNRHLRYKLEVKELDFVAQDIAYQGHKILKSPKAEVGIQNDQNRLYLWQVFFANPLEWWDRRNCKFNSKQPDFKHKDTGEALWLSERDPPWVKKQLKLLDSKIAEAGPIGRRSRVTNWLYDE